MTPPRGRFSLVAGAQDADRRLDQVLAEPLGSRAQAAKAIEAGRVRVDGRVVSKRHTVLAGQTIAVEPEQPAVISMAPVEVAFEVVYEDEHLLVVDKPAGVVVHPGRGHREGTLAQALFGRAGGGEDPARAGIVHRLDRDTSGLLVVAKSDEVHRELKTQLSARELHREYLAMVDGVPPARTGTVDAPIGRDRKDRLLMSIDTDAPREARTHFEVIEALPGAALLRVVLDTGRTHQIRVHMMAIGHPVTGDRQYGGSQRFGLQRQFLHASRLHFTHPITNTDIDINSNLPPDLQSALKTAQTSGS